jgi:hypothetical protein
MGERVAQKRWLWVAPARNQRHVENEKRGQCAPANLADEYRKNRSASISQNEKELA